MTRQWVDDDKAKPKDKRWVMRCDHGSNTRKNPERCTTVSEPFPNQPDLNIFIKRGWFIAKTHGDYCPSCVTLGRHGATEPHPFMHAQDNEPIIFTSREANHAQA